MTDWPTYQPVYPGWLTSQHTRLSVQVDWQTNIPANISGLPDQTTSQPICLGWLSQLNHWPTNLIFYPSWLTNQHTGLSLWSDWPTNIPAYSCQHTSLSLQADWLPNILDIIISIRVDWPTNMPEYLSDLTDWHTYQLIPAYPSGLTDRPIYLSNQNYWPTNIPDYPAWLTDQHTRPSIWADWLTNIPDYLPLLKFVYCQCLVSGLPVHAYYPPSYKDWLTSAFLFYLLIIISAYLAGLTDWPTSCYLRIYIWADCLSVRLTIMPVFLSCIPVWVN